MSEIIFVLVLLDFIFEGSSWMCSPVSAHHLLDILHPLHPSLPQVKTPVSGSAYGEFKLVSEIWTLLH